MKIRPLYDRIVVKRIEDKEQMQGGLYIPDTAKEKPQEGEVVAVGKGKRLEDGKVVTLDVQVGDRILFGKDIWEPSEYHTYFRVLETADEYFPYYRKRHAFWSMYGMDLPDDVLRKVYYKNAIRIIPGLSGAGFPK